MKTEEEKQLPDFLYEDNGSIKIGRHGDTDVTEEWNKYLKSVESVRSEEEIEKRLKLYSDGIEEIKIKYREALTLHSHESSILYCKDKLAKFQVGEFKILIKELQWILNK